MSVYIGYYHPTDSYVEASQTRARNGEPAFEPRFVQMVIDLPTKLPDGCTVVGSYTPIGGSPNGHPAVMIVETADTAHLQFISQYYNGYLEFQWAPASPIGANKAQREQWRETVATPEPAR